MKSVADALLAVVAVTGLLPACGIGICAASEDCGEPLLTLNSSLNFGERLSFSTSSQTLVISNPGEGAITGLSATVSQPFRLGDSTCGQLSTGESCQIRLDYLAPLLMGPHLGELVLTYQFGSRNYLRRVELVGSSTNGSFLAGSGTGFNSYVTSAAPAKDGSGDIYFAGDFTQYNGTTARYAARLNFDGTLDTGFQTGSGFDSGTIYVEVSDSDRVYYTGYFSSFNGTARGKIARLAKDGGLDLGFNPGSGLVGGDGHFIAIAGDGSGDLWVGGGFTQYNGTARQRIARVRSDGSLNTSFNSSSGFDDQIWWIREPSDGSGDVVATGFFQNYGAMPRARIARLNADGTVDPGFAIGSGLNNNGWVFEFLDDGTGDILSLGDFSLFNGATANRLARLRSNGTLNSVFSSGSGPNNLTFAIAKTTDPSRVYIGGTFTQYDGTSVGAIARLNANGTLDPSFIQGAGFTGGDVNVIALAPDGSGDIYVGGVFTGYGGTPVGSVVRLNANGGLE